MSEVNLAHFYFRLTTAKTLRKTNFQLKKVTVFVPIHLLALSFLCAPARILKNEVMK